MSTWVTPGAEAATGPAATGSAANVPNPGEAPTGPLTGVRVVSLAVNVPGPVAAARLVSYGAQVTKIEPPTGDPLATASPSWYAELATHQRVLSLDLKTAEGTEALAAEFAEADLLITAVRPSALARLGLPEMVATHGLAHVEIVGHDGEDAERPGHDLTFQAAQGTLAPPELPMVLVADLIGAEQATTAAFAALRARERGEPATIRVVLEAAARAGGAPRRHGLTGPGTALGGAIPSYRVYASADGYVAVAALEVHFATRYFALFGESADEAAERFATESSDYWAAFGDEHDIPIVAVR